MWSGACTNCRSISKLPALRARTIDIAINRNVLPYAEEHIRNQLIAHESVALAVPENDPLCQRGKVPLTALSGRPLISLAFHQSDFARQPPGPLRGSRILSADRPTR
ncbi:DNA-binding transcriptional activator XapR [Kluyvera cryocrescens]|uniref:DNA-binding transcriptional activator XapR n=1 Tax=Kluyvera cryocrescens TaxID=580 RepID=A0A485CHS3_KLUCR|nr:DNA-binding transcriptional activator XapR [Kluyvera cryocrescens]